MRDIDIVLLLGVEKSAKRFRVALFLLILVGAILFVDAFPHLFVGLNYFAFVLLPIALIYALGISLIVASFRAKNMEHIEKHEAETDDDTFRFGVLFKKHLRSFS